LRYRRTIADQAACVIFLFGVMMRLQATMAQVAAPADWTALKFLLGTWQNEEDAGVPGKSSKVECNFEPGLEERVICARFWRELCALICAL
jgi:hypothetical protein